MAKSKKKPPSRVRYEKSHPTVSCRVSKGIYDRLQQIKRRERRSFTDILKLGLGILELEAKKETEAYKKGWRDAEKRYKVIYYCSVCGDTLTVTTDKEKEAIINYMENYGWGHAKCHE